MAKVGKTTSPLNGSGSSSAGATNPVTHLNLHRSLREVVSTVGIGVGKSADEIAVEVPFDIRAGPVNGISVELGLR